MPSSFGALRPGDLRHKITIQKNVPIKNSRGVDEDNWVDAFSTMAQYIPQSGSYYFQDSAINTKFQAIFRTRWRPNSADSSMIIKSPFGVFSIVQPVDVDGVHFEEQYYCTSEIGNG